MKFLEVELGIACPSWLTKEQDGYLPLRLNMLAIAVVTYALDPSFLLEIPNSLVSYECTVTKTAGEPKRTL